MLTRRLLLAQLIVVALVAIGDIVALHYHLYWKYPWYDTPMHMLGGVWAGLFGAWLCSHFIRRPRILVCVVSALALGVVWEGFEYGTGITELPADTLDTIKDIMNDLVGGVAAYAIARRLYTDE